MWSWCNLLPISLLSHTGIHSYSILFQPYRTTPLVLPGAKVKKDAPLGECYLRHHPNPMIRAAPHHYEPYHPEVAMKQKVILLLEFIIFSVLSRAIGNEFQFFRVHVCRVVISIVFNCCIYLIKRRLSRWPKRYFSVLWDRMTFQRFESHTFVVSFYKSLLLRETTLALFWIPPPISGRSFCESFLWRDICYHDFSLTNNN